MSHLYVISEGVHGPIKVGRSNNALVRLATLQTGNPRTLTLVAAWELLRGRASEAEHLLHEEWREFCPDRSLVGEWFKMDEEFALEYIPDFFLANGFEGRRCL